MKTAKWPMSGKSSRDCRFFVTNYLQWGPEVRDFHLNAPPSQLTSFELAALNSVEPRHFVVGGPSLPCQAESIGFSNAGVLIASVNTGQTCPSENCVGRSRSIVLFYETDAAVGLLDMIES